MADLTGHQFTCGGNMKTPSRALLLSMDKSMLGEFFSETIKGSFKFCGITIATDATKDDVIYCFKEWQPWADGRAILAQKSCQHLQ